MKQLTPNSLRVLPAVAGMALGLWASTAQANYFDVDGTNPGMGTVQGGSYSWDDPNWSTSSAGTAATVNWVQGDFARFTGAGSYTNTVSNTETNTGMVLASSSGAGATLTINATGAGNLYIAPSSSLTAGLPAQGYFVASGQNLIINAPITGPGGMSISLWNSATPSIYLYGNNTYSGGTVLNSSSFLVYFNNNNSFGSGPICVNGTTFAPLVSQGGATITLPNSWTNISSSGVNFANGANTPVALNGPWAMQSFNLNLRNNGDSTAPLTVNGAISGSGILTLSANNNGTIILNGANTYSGQTVIGAGNSGVTLKVASLNKVSGGSPSSNLGAPTTAAAGTIGIGGAAQTSTLLYAGLGETTDRAINLAGTTGGAILQNDGSGALVFTSDFTATGAGAKSLTLQGNNTAANTISGKIVDNSAGNPTALVKAGTGTWKLAGANAYTGGTTVNAGTLEISGSVVGSVTNIAGTLTLDNPATMPVGATLAINSGSTVNLNFVGTNAVNSLIVDGGSMPPGVWGSMSSTAPNKSPILNGTGFINVLAKPVIVQQPLSGSVFPDQSFTFTVGVDGDLSTLTYQWKRNGVNLSDSAAVFGSATSTLTISPVEAVNAGTYSCAVTNAAGFAVSANATLQVMGTNAYTQTIRADSPAAYWRLDETSGSLAYDAIGGYLGIYRNVFLNQPGYSLTDSDPGIGLPGAAAGRGYVSVTNNTYFAFGAGQPFTLEGWAYLTNLTGVQTLFSTLGLASGANGWRFGVNGNTQLRFTAGAVADIDQTVNSAFVTGVWYHLALVSDGAYYHFYVNGVEQGPGTTPVSSPTGLGQPLTLGANPVAYTNNATGDPLGEQLKGRLDEMAVYFTALSTYQLSNHFYARYVDAPVPTPAMPVVSPATNYVSLATTLQENAAGVNLSYQWFKAPSTLLPGQTGSAMALSPLQLSDAGSYYVRVSNNRGSTNSPTNYVAVLAIPTSASQLNLTNALVLHLPFDGDYIDISGRSHNGTNVGATTFAPDGIVGKALHYSTDTTVGSTNYVTLGTPADLEFGASTDFTVAYWVRQPLNSQFTNLPFFASAPVGSGLGVIFAPYATDTTWGGWSEAIGSMSSPSAFTSFPDSGLINDGNWHHLVHSATRSANVITYLDGVQVDSQAIGFLGDISTTTPINIGQDSSGAYAVSASADLDDVAVWQRALSPLEISGMYLAAHNNHVSFAPPVVTVIPPVATTISSLSATTLSYTGGAGSHFVLLGTNNLAAPLNLWTRLATNSATPGSFTVPAVGAGAPMFYRVQSE